GLRSDGIVHVHFLKDVTLDVPLQIKMREYYDEITGGVKTKFLFSAEEGFTLTKEAREHGPKLQETSPILCYALVVNNLAYKIIASFYIKVVKAPGNYKLVNSAEEGVKWLHERDASDCG